MFCTFIRGIYKYIIAYVHIYIYIEKFQGSNVVTLLQLSLCALFYCAVGPIVSGLAQGLLIQGCCQ